MSSNSMFTFGDFRLTLQPGTSVTLTFTAESDTVDLVRTFVITSRECVRGEVKEEDGRCHECGEDEQVNPLHPMLSYTNLSPEDSENTQCKECPVEAYCFGGNKLTPRRNYSRLSEQSFEFFECLYPGSCLGSIDGTKPKGVCREGYEGKLCSKCVLGYSLNNDYECRKCAEPWMIIFNFVIWTIIFLICVPMYLFLEIRACHDKLYKPLTTVDDQHQTASALPTYLLLSP